MGLKEAKDGITLIADAIRKEKEVKAKELALKNASETNVADVTAQFKKPNVQQQTTSTSDEVSKKPDESSKKSDEGSKENQQPSTNNED